MDDAGAVATTPPRVAGEDDVVAALVALDAASSGAVDEAGTALCHAAVDLRDSGDTVSTALVSTLLRHGSPDARLAGAMLVRSTAAPPLDLIMEIADRDEDRRVRRRLVEALPHLGDRGIARAVELVLDEHPAADALVSGLVEEKQVGALLAQSVSSEVLGALAKNLADTLDGSDRSRALAEAAVGRIADLADALRDPGECASFLIGMVRAGQGPRTAALALDHSRTTTTRLSALDALDNDESWRVLEDTASRLLDYAVSGAGVRLRAVELLESVARRGEADRDAIVARLRTAATRDASPEVRAAARRVAEQLTKN